MSNFVWGIDGVIITVYIALSLYIGIRVRKYVRDARDFIAAGQNIDLYAGLASLAATEFGIITAMGQAQFGYRYGFSGITLGILFFVAMTFLGRTGFCLTPLRESGVLSLPEFFSIKYTPGIRRLMATMMFIAGVLNMGLFLRTGGDFLVITMGLNPKFLEITMTILLFIVLTYVMLGGLLSVLVTDFVQFMIMGIGVVVITGIVVSIVGWNNMTATVAEKYGEGGFNPFLNKSLGWQYVLFTFMSVFSTSLTFQPIISRVLASKNAEVGRKLYQNMGLFNVARSTIPILWGIAALTILSPGEVSSPILGMPTMLAKILPFGVMGILIASMLAADMSTMSSYLLAWSSLLWNDLLVIFHKNEWSDRKAVAVNRLLVFSIGIFLLFYGLWYPIKGDLWVYLAVVGRIATVSATIILICGCYWKKASIMGAYICIIVGAIGPISYMVAEQTPQWADLAKQIGPFVSGNVSYLAAVIAMIIGSLLFPDKKSVENK